jgi:hypothetical protein
MIEHMQRRRRLSAARYEKARPDAPLVRKDQQDKSSMAAQLRLSQNMIQTLPSLNSACPMIQEVAVLTDTTHKIINTHLPSANPWP